MDDPDPADHGTGAMTTGMYPEDPVGMPGSGPSGGVPHPAHGAVPAPPESGGHQPPSGPRGFAPPPWYSAPSAPVRPGGYAPPPGVPGYPQAPGWGPGLPPPPRRGMPGWVIALICTMATLFIGGILAAIAIPVFPSQHAKAEYQATALALPDTINGIPRLSGGPVPVDQSLETEVKRVLPQATIDTAAYRDGGTAVAIILIRPGRALNAADQLVLRTANDRLHRRPGRDHRDQAERRSPGGLVRLRIHVHPDHDVCGVVDASSLMVIVVSGQGPDAVNLARTAREAVEHRK